MSGGARRGGDLVLFDPNASIFSRGLALAREIPTVSGRIRVVIVDDIEATCSNLTRLLGFEPDIEVVGVAFGRNAGKAGVELTRTQLPDIVLMDICMPDIDGITATEIIRADKVWKGAVIMMSVQGEQDYLRRAMLAGAVEYLVKPFSADEFVTAIRHVHHLRAFGPGPCDCAAQAVRRAVGASTEAGDETASDPATDPWWLMLAAGDQVFDSASVKHGSVLGVFSPSSYAREPWNRDDAGWLWEIQYADGTIGSAWSLDLSPWEDAAGTWDDAPCVCGHLWSRHFGNGGARPCRVSWMSETKPTDCDNFIEDDFLAVEGEAEDHETTVVDLMAALRASIVKSNARARREAWQAEHGPTTNRPDKLTPG